VIIQLIMVAIVVIFPNIVMHYKAAGPVSDDAAVQKTLDNLLMPPGLGGPGAPGGDLPGLNFNEPPKIQ